MAENDESPPLTFRPANEATWEDVELVFGAGSREYCTRCRCQRFKVRGWIWRDSTEEQRIAMQQAQTACGQPDAPSTSGLIAYLGEEPVGWVAVEPRTAYPKLATNRLAWTGRPQEDKTDDSVWAITCFIVRKGWRGQGLMYELCAAAAEHARSRGARAVEGYPTEQPPGKEITWGEAHIGTLQVFLEAGFEVASSPTLRRRVARLDL